MEGARSGRLFEREQGNLGCRVGDDDLGVQQADEGDEQADAGRNGFLQGHGDGVEDSFADIGQRQDDEDNAFKEDGGQGHFPGVAHLQDDRKGEEGVQAHARCQSEGIVGEKGHAQRPDKGSQGGCREDGTFVHAGGAHDGRVDGQDVGHGHEGRDTSQDFRADRRAIFAQVEETVEEGRLVFHNTFTLL